MDENIGKEEFRRNGEFRRGMGTEDAIGLRFTRHLINSMLSATFENVHLILHFKVF